MEFLLHDSRSLDALTAEGSSDWHCARCHQSQPGSSSSYMGSSILNRRCNFLGSKNIHIEIYLIYILLKLDIQVLHTSFLLPIKSMKCAVTSHTKIVKSVYTTKWSPHYKPPQVHVCLSSASAFRSIDGRTAPSFLVAAPLRTHTTRTRALLPRSLAPDDVDLIRLADGGRLPDRRRRGKALFPAALKAM